VVHGYQYKKEQGAASLTDANAIQTNVINPRAAGFDTSKFTVTVTYDDASQMPEYYTGPMTAQVNQVTVTVSYDWQPEVWLPSMTLTSTSKMLMWY
jgi:hypothetical protein